RRKLNRVKLEGFAYDVSTSDRARHLPPRPTEHLSRASKAASRNDSPKVFDRFAAGLAFGNRKSTSPTKRTAARSSGNGHKSRPGRQRDKAQEATWVEGMI